MSNLTDATTKKIGKNTRFTIHSWVVGIVITIMLFSLPPKWSTLPLASIILLFALFFINREDVKSPTLRVYFMVSLAILVPTILASIMQHFLKMDTATEWHELFYLNLRILGIGLALILVLEREWITLEIFIKIVISVAAFYIITSLYFMYNDPRLDLTQWRGIRIDYWANPNSFGLYLSMVTVLVIGLLKIYPKKISLWLMGFATIICLYATGSRGAVIATMIGILVLFPPIYFRRAMSYIIATVIMISAFFILEFELTSGSSDSARIETLKFAWEAFLGSPWWGWGLKSFSFIPGHYGVHSPHNMWADAAVSSGIFALFFIAFVFAWVGLKLFLTKRLGAHLMLGLLTAYLISGTLEGSILVSTEWRNIGVIILAISVFVGWGSKHAQSQKKYQKEITNT